MRKKNNNLVLSFVKTEFESEGRVRETERIVIRIRIIAS